MGWGCRGMDGRKSAYQCMWCWTWARRGEGTGKEGAGQGKKERGEDCFSRVEALCRLIGMTRIAMKEGREGRREEGRTCPRGETKLEFGLDRLG